MEAQFTNVQLEILKMALIKAIDHESSAVTLAMYRALLNQTLKLRDKK